MSEWDSFPTAQSDGWDAFPTVKGGINNVVRSAASGVPIVGGALNKLEAGTNALLSYGLNPLFDKKNQLTGSIGERYENSLKQQNAMDQGFEEAHPIIDAAAKVAGGVGAGGALLKAAPVVGARILGLGGETLPGQAIRGAVSGAGIGATDAAVRGENPITGAEVGGVMGGVAPVAARAVGSAVDALRGLKQPAAIPANTLDVAGVPVRRSLGQLTGDVDTQMMEQGALRNTAGQREQQVAQDFFDAQNRELGQARDAIGRSFDPSGNIIASSPHDAAGIVGQHARDLVNQRDAQLANQAAELGQQHEAIRTSLAPQGQTLASSPYEAADFVSQAVGNAAEQARNATRRAYQNLRELPGTFHPATFNRAGNMIRDELNSGADPIRIDPQRTPIANGALNELDEILGPVQQQRDALGRVLPRTEPITPALVETTRQRLNAAMGDAINTANRTGDRADLRAMGGIMDAFDNYVMGRLRNGTFRGGDPAGVIQAMQNARQLNTNFRRTFTRQGAGDQVGPIIEQIVGRQEGQAAPPEQIQQWLYGNGATPVKVAQRLVNTFGANSPEIGAIKQGLFSHLTEPPPGKTFDAQQMSDRINGFLNDKGRTLSQIYLTAPERAQLSQYAQALERHAQFANRPQDEIDRILGKIAGQNGGVPANTSEILDYLQGANGTGSRGISEKLVSRLKDSLGENSSEWNALRQAQWKRLTEATEGKTGFGPQKESERIFEFLNGSGKPLAEAMFSQNERNLISEYGKLLKQLTPKPGTVNYSNTAATLGKMMRGSIDGLFAAGGFHAAGPLGLAAGMAGHSAQKAIGDVVKASKVARSLYGTPSGAIADRQLMKAIERMTTVTARGATSVAA